MSRPIVGFLLLLTLAACQTEDSRVVTQQVSPEGQTFTFMPVYEDGVTDISIEIAWPTTWAYEDNRNPAVPFVATRAILSGGTTKLQPQDLMLMFEDTNTYGNLAATPQHVFGSLSFPKEHTSSVLDVVAEMLAQPLFDARWFEREKSIFADAIEAQSKTAEQQMWAAARSAIFEDQAVLSTLNLMDPDVVMDVTVADARDWQTSFITKKNAVVVVTGAISSKDAGKAVDKLLSGLPEGEREEIRNATANFQPVEILLHDPKAAKTTIGLIGQLPWDQRGLFYDDNLAMGFFSRSGQSALFDAVRSDLRASYDVFAGVENFDAENRLLYISTGVETRKLAAARDLIRTTYETYRTAPDFSGFDTYRRGFADFVAEDIDYIDGAADAILLLELFGQDSSLVPQAEEFVLNTKASDVANRMKNVFPQADRLIVVAVSPDAQAMPGACVITTIDQAKDCR